MKKTKLLFAILLSCSIFCLQSCNTETKNTGTFSDDLSASEKEQITSEILALTDDWANAHCQMNADKASELWDNSSDLMFAENGEFFASWKAIHDYLVSFYSSTTSMNVKWEQRVVIPLSLNSASIAGHFHAYAVFKTGETFDIHSMFTGVFVKKNNKWVLIQGQESFKL